MLIDNLTFNAMYSVLQSGMWLLNDLETFLRPFEMTQARLSILLAVQNSSDGVISPNEIAVITGKSRPAITRSIERLEESGLLAINRDYEDGRRKKLSITEDGNQLLENIIPEYNKRIYEMSSKLSEEERKMLIQLLGKINFLDNRKKIGSFE